MGYLVTMIKIKEQKKIVYKVDTDSKSEAVRRAKRFFAAVDCSAEGSVDRHGVFIKDRFKKCLRNFKVTSVDMI